MGGQYTHLMQTWCKAAISEKEDFIKITRDVSKIQLSNENQHQYILCAVHIWPTAAIFEKDNSWLKSHHWGSNCFIIIMDLPITNWVVAWELLEREDGHKSARHVHAVISQRTVFCIQSCHLSTLNRLSQLGAIIIGNHSTVGNTVNSVKEPEYADNGLCGNHQCVPTLDATSGNFHLTPIVQEIATCGNNVKKSVTVYKIQIVATFTLKISTNVWLWFYQKVCHSCTKCN